MENLQAQFLIYEFVIMIKWRARVAAVGCSPTAVSRVAPPFWVHVRNTVVDQKSVKKLTSGFNIKSQS